MQLKASPDFKNSQQWTRLQIALARYAGIGRTDASNGRDPRKLPLSDLDYMVLTAMATADRETFPHLNQQQLRQFLQEKSRSGVSTSIKRLSKEKFCRELSQRERMALNLPVNGRSKYYQVTNRGIEALLAYESVRFALPPVVVQALQDLPEYSIVLQTLTDTLRKVLADEFAEIGR